MAVVKERTKEIAGCIITRRRLRYVMYRIQNELAGGALASEDAETIAIKTYFEAMDEFGGWENFSVLWDVGPPGYHHRIVERKESKAKEWEDKLKSLTKIPTMGSGNLETFRNMEVDDSIGAQNLEALKELKEQNEREDSKV